MAKNFMKEIVNKQPEGAIDTKALISKIESGYLIDQVASFKTRKLSVHRHLSMATGPAPDTGT